MAHAFTPRSPDTLTSRKDIANTMNPILRSVITLATFAALGAGNIANAQTYTFFPGNATISSATGTTNNIVGYDGPTNYTAKTNGTSPTIQVGAGAN